MGGEQARLADLRFRHLWPLWVAGASGCVSSARAKFGFDSHAYWLTAHHAALYGLAPKMPGAYEYSPVFAQLIWPVAHWLPWLAFGILWSAMSLTVFAWLLAPLGWRLAVPGVLCCGSEIIRGNVHAMLAAALVLGMARPGVWAFPLLTKVTPGLGPFWFVVRGEWRKAAVAVGATLAIAGVSFAMAPKLWISWLRFLLAHQGEGSLALPVRLVIAAAVTTYAARSHRPRLMPWAMILGLPVLDVPVLTLLAALPRLPASAADRADAAAAVGPVSHLPGDGAVPIEERSRSRPSPV